MNKPTGSRKPLSAKQREELLQALRARFERNLNRHPGLEWPKVQARLESQPEKLWSLAEMEKTGGEPDLVRQDTKTGELVFVDGIAAGGVHITQDIARGLATPMNHAERMKTLFGSALPSPSDERELIDVPVIGETDRDVTNQVPRSVLVGIVRPRAEEIFELVRSRLEAAGMDRVAGRHGEER